MVEAKQNVEVTLEKKFPKQDSKNIKRVFPINQANTLLNLPNPQWKLSDDNFKWNGEELTVSKTEQKDDTKEVAKATTANK